MAGKKDPRDKIVDAALKLAETRSWRDIRLTDIAGEAGITLAELAGHVSGKSHILGLFARRVDRQLLAALEEDPVEGGIHDRLFDIIMRRLELMEPHRKAIANIIAAPGESAADWARLYGSLIQSQTWILSAAGLDDSGPRAGLKVNGLAYVYGRTLRVWAQDDEAGKARTMAELDRALRDGADWLRRLDTPMALWNAFGGLARGLWRNRTRQTQSSTQPEPAARPGNQAES